MLYTLGYAGRSPVQVLELVTALDAIVVDIRYHPHSGHAGWGRRSLECRFGERYLWVGELGNRSHRQGVIEIPDLAGGVAIVVDLLTSSSVVLMCSCRGFDNCHRRPVAKNFTRLGYSYEELSL